MGGSRDLVILHEDGLGAIFQGEPSGTWWIGFVGSTVTAVTFLAVALLLGVSLSKTRQWRHNPLGLGTFWLFVTCGGGHLIHSIQLLYPTLGIFGDYGAAIRTEYADWHIWLADGATALAGVWYWTMRKRFPELVTGTAVYEDLRGRHLHALEIHDNVVQELAKAKLALDLDEDDDAGRALERALAASERISHGMMEETGAERGGGGTSGP